MKMSSLALPQLIIRPGEQLAGIWWAEFPPQPPLPMGSVLLPRGGRLMCYVRYDRATSDMQHTPVWRIHTGKQAEGASQKAREILGYTPMWTWFDTARHGQGRDIVARVDESLALTRQQYAGTRTGSVVVSGDVGDWRSILLARLHLLPPWMHIVCVENAETAAS